MNIKSRLPYYFIIAILAAAPFVLLICFITRFSVDVPFSDDWAMIPYLQKSYQGILTIRDLFEQHNENRIFFPRILIIGLARITGWNTCYENAVIVFMALLTFLILAYQSIRTGMACHGNMRLWRVIFLSALMFSLLQYECWTFGHTLIGYTTNLCVVAGLALLVHTPFSWLYFAGSLLCGTIATFSCASGVFYWFIGLPALFTLSRERQTRSVSPYIVWLLFASGILALYFVNYQKPDIHPRLLFFLEYPDASASYLFAFMGGAIVSIPGLPFFVPITIGALGLLLFMICASVCFCLAGREVKSVSLWLALGAYTVIICLSAVLGRSAYGVQHALSSRYTIFSSLFWVSTLVMSTTVLEHVRRHLINRKKRMVFLSLTVALLMFGAVCLALFIVSSGYAIKAWNLRYANMRAIRNEFLSFLPDQALLEDNVPEAGNDLMIWADWLAERRLSLFREKKAFQDYRLSDTRTGHVESVEVDLLPGKVFSDGKAQLSGRAYDPERGQAARAVLLVNSNRLIIARADVTPDSKARWSLALKATKLPVGKSTINVYALFQDGTRIARIGELNFEMFPISDIKTIFQINNIIDHPDVIAGAADIFYLDNDLVRGSGWARDPATDQPAKWIVVINQETNILAYARITDERKDVADQFKNKDLFLCGWQVAFDTTLLGPGRHILWAYLFLPNENKAVRLNNGYKLTIP